MVPKVGDRVRDKFKHSRSGDESVHGTVVKPPMALACNPFFAEGAQLVTVEMETYAVAQEQFRTMDLPQFKALFECEAKR